MQLLGALLFALGSAGTAYATWATFHRKRPVDVAFAVVAPVAVAVAVIGLVLVFVPGFFG